MRARIQTDEGLRADDGTNLVAVDVDIKDMDALDDLLYAIIDPRMQVGCPTGPL